MQLKTVDMGDKVFQILASTLEFKVGESRKESSCYRGRAYSIVVDSGDSQLEFELGQSGQTCDHRLG